MNIKYNISNLKNNKKSRLKVYNKLDAKHSNPINRNINDMNENSI